MNVTKAKPSELEEKNFEIQRINQSENTEESTKAYTSLTGNEPKEKLSSNEYLNNNYYINIMYLRLLVINTFLGNKKLNLIYNIVIDI